MRAVNVVGAAAFLPAFAACIRDCRLRRELALPLLGYGITLGGWLALNAAWFGDPFVTAYDRVLVMDAGARSVASIRDFFHRPFLASLASTMFDARYGFTRTAPHWPLLVLSALPMARRDGWRFAALVVMVAAPVLAIVRYDFWSASAVGNRFMLFSATASSVGIAWLVDSVKALSVSRRGAVAERSAR
jgi:hypothetical protein